MQAGARETLERGWILTLETREKTWNFLVSCIFFIVSLVFPLLVSFVFVHCQLLCCVSS